MSFKHTIIASAGAAALLAATAAHAGFTGSTVDITAANGFASGASICKDGVATGRTVGAGNELAGVDWTGGCVGYYSADLSDSQIALTGIESGNYSFASLHIHVASGATITGVSFAGYTPNFFQTGYPNNDSNFSPTVTFDADDIDIGWDTSSDSSQFAFNAPANGGSEPFGSALFNVTTNGSTVPEPATLALLGLGLAVIAARRRGAAR